MITDLIERIFGRSSRQSGKDARQRLKLVIANDRSGLSPEMMEAMRRDIVEVVSRYVEIDPAEMEFSLESDQRMTALIANLPVKKVRRRRSRRPSAPTNYTPPTKRE